MINENLKKIYIDLDNNKYDEILEGFRFKGFMEGDGEDYRKEKLEGLKICYPTRVREAFEKLSLEELYKKINDKDVGFSYLPFGRPICLYFLRNFYAELKEKILDEIPKEETKELVSFLLTTRIEKLLNYVKVEGYGSTLNALNREIRKIVQAIIIYQATGNFPFHD